VAEFLALRPSISRGLPLSGEDPSISGCFNIAFKKLSMVFTTYGSHGFFPYFLGFARGNFGCPKRAAKIPIVIDGYRKLATVVPQLSQ